MSQKSLNPQIISLARESRGILQRQLAMEVSVTQGTLSKIEGLELVPPDDLIKKFSKALGYPEGLFFLQGSEVPPMLSFIRKTKKVSQKVLKRVNATVNLYRIIIESAIEKSKIDLSIPEIFYSSPEQAAIELRKQWAMQPGVVGTLTELLENHGIILFGFDFKAPNLDSRPILTEKKHPIIIYNQRLLGDRLRFTLAFELGNIVMHVFNPVDLKHQANLFAAEFLMPEENIRKDFNENITIELLAELKLKWKVSMQSLLFRANTLGIITDNQKRYLWSQFKSRGIDKREPPEVDIPVEKSNLIFKIMNDAKRYKDCEPEVFQLLIQESLTSN